MEVNPQTLLTDYAPHEKAAYLGALAALATADRKATEEEIGQLREVAEAAGISSEEERSIIDAAQDPTGNDLKKCLDTLKGSNLKYSLITDLIAVAKADDSYTQEEQRNIQKVARYMNVNQDQFSALDELVTKAAEQPHSPEDLSKPNFIQSTGMESKLQDAGLNIGSMGKSLLGFLGPMILGSLAGKALGGGRKGSGGLGGLAGGVLGGMLGGGGTSGMNLLGGMGGLGSLISGLNKGRSNNSIGGMLGKIFQ